MNRRGFLWAVGAAGLAMMGRVPAGGAEAFTGARMPAETTKVEKLIQQAVREKRLLTFRYHGFERSVEPHAVGRVNDGKLALLGWQSAGGSATEPPPGWRTFIAAEMEKPKLRKTKFAARPDYDPKKTNLKEITLEIAR